MLTQVSVIKWRIQKIDIIWDHVLARKVIATKKYIPKTAVKALCTYQLPTQSADCVRPLTGCSQGARSKKGLVHNVKGPSRAGNMLFQFIIRGQGAAL